MVDFLVGIHYEERLCDNFIVIIVLNIFSIGLKGHYLAASQLVDLMTVNLVGLGHMELKFKYLLCASLGLSIVDLFAVSTDEMPADHLFWLALANEYL